MKVYLRDEERIMDLKGTRRIKEIVEKDLGLNPEEVLVIDRKRGKILPPDSEFVNDDEIEIRSIISGG